MPKNLSDVHIGCTCSITVSLRKMPSTSGAEERNDVCICVGVICVWRCSRFSSSHMFLEYIFSSLALPTRCWLHSFPTGWRHCQSGQRLCQVANRFACMFSSQDSALLGEGMEEPTAFTPPWAHGMQTLESPGIGAELKIGKSSQLSLRKPWVSYLSAFVVYYSDSHSVPSSLCVPEDLSLQAKAKRKIKTSLLLSWTT